MIDPQVLKDAALSAAQYPVLAIDFDHTLQAGNGLALGPPTPGAVDALRNLSSDHILIIFTARTDFQSVWEWLAKYGVQDCVLDVTNVKPQAAVEFVDDRGTRFTGSWTPEFINDVRNFKPYYKMVRGGYRRPGRLFHKSRKDNVADNPAWRNAEDDPTVGVINIGSVPAPAPAAASLPDIERREGTEWDETVQEQKELYPPKAQDASQVFFGISTPAAAAQSTNPNKAFNPPSKPWTKGYWPVSAGKCCGSELAKYSADQPRVPAGQPGGGEFGDMGGEKSEAERHRIRERDRVREWRRRRAEAAVRPPEAAVRPPEPVVVPAVPKHPIVVPKSESLTRPKPGFLSKPTPAYSSRDMVRDHVQFGPGNDKEQYDLFCKSFKMTPQDYRAQVMKGLPDILQKHTSVTIERLSSDSGDILVELKNNIFSQARTFYFKDLTVGHEFWRIERAEEGKGLAKTVFSNQLELYDHLGLNNATVHANMDVGGYAWARYGFTPNQRSWDSLRGQLESRLKDIDDRISRGNVRRILESSDPKSIWALASLHQPNRDSTIGKTMLLGTNWSGTLSLNNSDSYSISRSYVGKKEKGL